MINYCKASYSDLDQMVKIWFLGFSDFLKRTNWKVSTLILRDALELYIDSGYATVAKDEDKVLGYSIWFKDIKELWKTLKTDKWKSRAWKFYLTQRLRFLVPQCKISGAHYPLQVVHPEHQGKGIGSKLADLVLEQVEDKGIKSITFFTEASNDRLISLYIKRGFKEVKRIKKAKSEWLLMEKTF